MGDVIDATGQFRMRRLEADVERADRKVIRADTHPELFEHRDLQSYELYRSKYTDKEIMGLIEKQQDAFFDQMKENIERAERTQIWDLKDLNEVMKSDIDNIILPPTLEED